MPTTTPVTVTHTAPKWALSAADWLKSLAAAVITPVIPIITQTLQNNSLTFPVKSIEIAAALGFVTFISFKLLSPSQTIIKGTTEGATITNLTIPTAGTSTTTTQTK
jgi:hypothetical protein